MSLFAGGHKALTHSLWCLRLSRTRLTQWILFKKRPLMKVKLCWFHSASFAVPRPSHRQYWVSLFSSPDTSGIQLETVSKWHVQDDCLFVDQAGWSWATSKLLLSRRLQSKPANCQFAPVQANLGAKQTRSLARTSCIQPWRPRETEMAQCALRPEPDR